MRDGIAFIFYRLCTATLCCIFLLLWYLMITVSNSGRKVTGGKRVSKGLLLLKYKTYLTNTYNEITAKSFDAPTWVDAIANRWIRTLSRPKKKNNKNVLGRPTRFEWHITAGVCSLSVLRYPTHYLRIYSPHLLRCVCITLVIDAVSLSNILSTEKPIYCIGLVALPLQMFRLNHIGLVLSLLACI
jgi:hypothetical protein